MAAIQFQTVLYHNQPESLIRSASSIANAARVAQETLHQPMDVTLSWGDASPEPIFTDETIRNIQETELGNQIRLKYRFFNQNTGTSLGHNMQAKDATADYLILMNPDVVVSTNFLQCLLPHFDDPAVGMVEARQMPVEHPKSYDQKTLEVDWTSGACSMIRTECFRQLDGYDAESFFLYNDDVDLSWRARIAGWKLLYDPRATVYHAKGMNKVGALDVTMADRIYTPESVLILMYKYGRNQELEDTLNMLKNSEYITDREAAERFEERMRTGRLPKPVEHAELVSSNTREDSGTARYRISVEEPPEKLRIPKEKPSV